MSSCLPPAFKTPRLDGSSVAEKRAEIKHYFEQTNALYDLLFSCIDSEEAYFLRPEPLRHPLIFYFGHTATFFINKLMLGQYIDDRINERFESMFAVGVDEMSWDDLNTEHYDWPSVTDVAEYRYQVRHVVLSIIETMPLELPITKDSLAWMVIMGIEHERIHLETSSVIIRMLPLNCINTSAPWPACSEFGTAPTNQLLPVAGKPVHLGRQHDHDVFGWDNEFGSKEVVVGDFQASQYLVSNQEFLYFIEAGGYQNANWWTEEGQAWLAYSKATMPRFWSYRDGQFWQRNLLSEIPLPLNWPVEINYLEAKAFCNWKSHQENTNIRLPTEAEWTLLRDTLETDLSDWEKAPGNINLEYYASSCPVDRFKQNGIYDLIGNVWQWTESPIDGFPGFTVHKLYDDFSTPTFDGKHNLIKGGSWISTGNLATKKSRYAFRRHFFQHAGFRYVQSADTIPTEKMNVYETDAAVAQYLEFHYGDTYFDVPNFPVACINHLRQFVKQQSDLKALDLGCSVGRASFELASFCTHVDAIDFSARFIQQGVKLQEEGMVRFTTVIEGELVEYKEFKLASTGFDPTAANIHFIQGDACNLKPLFTDYHVVFCGNLIDRLYDPALFLSTVGERILPGGILVLTSPYTWMEEYTEKAHWLGGVKIHGENQTTLDGLKSLLTPEFTLVNVADLPFVIRETARKFQHSIAQVTVWMKN